MHRSQLTKVVSSFSWVGAMVILAGLRCVAQTQETKAIPSAMLDCSGMPCVDVTAGDSHHLKLLIDTGNANSILDLTKAKELGLEVKQLSGPDGKPYPGYFKATLTNVKIGDVLLGDVDLLAIDLQPDIEKKTMPKADGTLAYTALDGRILTMDYKQRQISLSDVLKADQPCPGFCGTITNPTFGKKGPPIVVTTGFTLNGKPITVQIDTLYSGSTLIYPTSVDRLGLAEQQKSARKRMFPFTDGGVEMIEGKADSQSFDTSMLKKNAPIYFATPKVHAPDGMFDGTVGQELFEGHVLSFDFFGHRFWMS